MDWNAAIDHNREALKGVLASLAAMAGFVVPFLRGRDARDSGVRPTLPRHLHRAVLRLLRPAEAAARRLVVVAARGIVVTLVPPRPYKAKPGLPFVRNGVGTGIVPPHGVAYPGHAARPAIPPRARGFALFDPLPTPFRRNRPKPSGVPRIWALGGPDPLAIPIRKPAAPDDPVDATRLGQRLATLASVLDDLPKYAKRFARWRAKNIGVADTREKDAVRPRSRWPLKPGSPPGARRPGSRREAHEVDDILSDTHGLAFFVLAHPDTS